MSTPTPVDKISVDKVLEKIQLNHREELKIEFKKLEELRIQEPHRLLTEAQQAKDTHKAKIAELEKQIKIIKGEVTEDESGMKIKSGLLLLRQDYDKAENIALRENLRREIEEQERDQRGLEKSLKESQELFKKANENVESAKLLNEQLTYKKHAIQNALRAQGLTDPIYNIDNINTSSLRISVSAQIERDDNPLLASQPPRTERLQQQEDKKTQKVGYLSKPDDLEKSMKSIGLTAVLKNNDHWNVKDANGKTYTIDNQRVTCVADKDDKPTLEKMVELFVKGEYNKFIAQGGKPDDFDESKIKPKASGEAAAEILKLCEEKGIGTAYSAQPKSPSPTNISRDDTQPETPRSSFSP